MHFHLLICHLYCISSLNYPSGLDIKVFPKTKSWRGEGEDPGRHTHYLSDKYLPLEEAKTWRETPFVMHRSKDKWKSECGTRILGKTFWLLSLYSSTKQCRAIVNGKGTLWYTEGNHDNRKTNF